MFLLFFVQWHSDLCQEEGTATTSFISGSLQTVDSEKMTIEDEEMFMNVAIQMYAGKFSFLRTLWLSCLNSYVWLYARLAGTESVGHVSLIN